MFDKLVLGYYRAYNDPQTFEFARPDNGDLGLNILVGQNNAGKSTALALLKELFHQSPDFIHDSMSRVGDKTPLLKLMISFENTQQTLYCEERAHGFYSKIIEGKTLAESSARRNQLRRCIQFLPSRRSWSDRFNRMSTANKSQLEDQLYNVERSQEAQLGQLLSGVIREDKKEKFDSILRRVMPDVLDWGINRVLDQDYIEYKSPAGRLHALSLLGEGFSSVFRMTYTIYSSKPGDVVILDEPELSLHPTAQRSLYALLCELSLDRQVIIATHSPYMLTWESLRRGARLFRVGIDESRTAKVHHLSPQTINAVLPVVNGDLRNRKLFDVLAKEVFFRGQVVFCEGQEDVHYIENFLSVAGRKELPLFGYGAGGAALIEKWLELASELGIKSAAIYDADEQKTASHIIQKFAIHDNIRIWILPANDIRDKTKAAGEQKGVFTTKGSINHEFKEDFLTMLDQIEQWLGH